MSNERKPIIHYEDGESGQKQWVKERQKGRAAPPPPSDRAAADKERAEELLRGISERWDSAVRVHIEPKTSDITLEKVAALGQKLREENIVAITAALAAGRAPLVAAAREMIGKCNKAIAIIGVRPADLETAWKCFNEASRLVLETRDALAALVEEVESGE